MAACSAAALLGAADFVGIDRSSCIAVILAATVSQNARFTIFPIAEFPGRRPVADESNPEDVPGQPEREDYREISHIPSG
jgi:hypothetical protein